MTITFDDALRIARKSIGDLTGDASPEVLRFELRDGFNFRFRTSKGEHDITIEPSGAVGRFARADAAPPSNTMAQEEGSVPVPQGITRQVAVERALSYAGGGRVEKVKPSDGGWRIEIDRGLLKPEVTVFVDASGEVHEKKRSKMDFLGLDLD